MTGRRFHKFGPFRLDADGRMLFRGSTPVQIPPKAIDTLLVLIENAGAVIDKEEILKHVWKDAFVEEGSLTRTVSILRKALGRDENGQEYIATVSKRLPVRRRGPNDTRAHAKAEIDAGGASFRKHEWRQRAGILW
jgi:DNA-binding winged helix-turn-helix (wHTH) protein